MNDITPNDDFFPDTQKLKALFEDALRRNEEVYREHMEIEEYYHGEQLPEEVKQTLEARGKIFEIFRRRCKHQACRQISRPNQA